MMVPKKFCEDVSTSIQSSKQQKQTQKILFCIFAKRMIQKSFKQRGFLFVQSSEEW